MDVEFVEDHHLFVLSIVERPFLSLFIILNDSVIIHTKTVLKSTAFFFLP
jgi:hypothetical protein